MAYIECKIWLFSDDLLHHEERWEAMKTGHRHYTVKALIDTSSSANKISRSIADRLGRKYGNHYKNKKVKNSLGTIDCLDLSFRYKGKDRLLTGSDETFNDFEVNKDHYLKADLILGLSWLWLRKAKIDIQKEGIKIYDNFIPFCKGSDNDESFYNSEAESPKSDSVELRKKVKKLERTVDWIENYVEEQTGIEPGKELDSFDSDYDYVSCERSASRQAPIDPEKKKKSSNKEVKPRRNPIRAVRLKDGIYFACK